MTNDQVCHLVVVPDAGGRDGLAAEGAAQLQMPAQDHVGRALPVPGSDRQDVGVAQHLVSSLGRPRGDGAGEAPGSVRRAEGGVGLEHGPV